MCPEKFPGEEDWSDFKAIRQDEPHKASPVAAFLIYAVLTLAAGVAGAAVAVLAVVGSRRSFWVPVEARTDPTWICLEAVGGFLLGALWALKAILDIRRRSR